MGPGDPRGQGAAPQADAEGEGRERAAPGLSSQSLHTDGCPSRPLPQEAQGGTTAASPHLTPPRCRGRERSPRSPPFPPPPSSPHPREGRYNLWLQLYTSEKKKFAECPTLKKKKIRNRAKKTCEWAWRMGLLKLRWSRGSPSHSASLRERSLARPARPPAPWTSEQVGARRPRPRPPPPPGSLEIRFHPPAGSPKPGAGTCPRQPGSGRWRQSRAPSRAARRDAAFLESAPRGQEVAGSAAGSPGDPQPRGGGHGEPQPGGVPPIPTDEPRAKVGESESEAGAGLREGDAARGAVGAGEEEGGEGGDRGEPGAGPAGGEGGRHLGPCRSPSPARREERAGRRAGERGGEAESRARPGRAAGRTRGFPAGRRAAGAHHAARGRGAGGR